MTILDKTDFLNLNNILDEDKIYIGAKADITIKGGTISHDTVSRVKNYCCKYYMELCSQISTRIKFDDEVLVAVQCLDPKRKAESLAPLIRLFPNLIDDDAIEDLDEEWRFLTNQETVDIQKNFEDFWRCIFNMRNAANEKMYPNLRNFVGAILSFPHSSATAERIFSQVNLIKDKKRNLLLTSTVNAILMARELLDGTDASQWNPSKELLTKYNK